MSWMRGHDTGFHDHGDSAAAMTVVSGEIFEQRLSLRGTVGTSLAAGDVVTLGSEAIHCVRHAGSLPSVSIHAYSPPLQRLGSYVVGPDGVLLRLVRGADTPLAELAVSWLGPRAPAHEPAQSPAAAAHDARDLVVVLG